MAITMRCGNSRDFDPTKMQTAEFAVCLDNGYVYITLSPGNVIRLGTADSIEQALALAQQCVSQASTSATSALTSKRNAEAWAVGQKDGTDVPSTDPTYHNNAKYWAEQAAQGSGASPATPTSLGIVKPDNTTINVDGNGVISGYVLGETSGTVYEGSKGKANEDAITAINGKIPDTATSVNKLATASDIATKADLVDGKVPAAQLPSFVDDVLEYASTSAFPATGESGKIYVALDTNKTYRWGGSDYVEISESLALGETSSTAYAGDKGKANADNITAIQELIPDAATTSNKLATVSDTTKAAISAEILTRRTVGYTAKNFVHIPASVVDTTDNGITYTITRNSEGEVTQIELNGTATADSTLELNPSVDVYKQTTGTMLITGFENADAHTSEYKFFFEKISGATYHAYIKVYSGVTVTNLICKPMVRDSKSSDIFEPYHNPLTDIIPSGASSSNKLATASDIEPFTTAQINALKALV